MQNSLNDARKLDEQAKDPSYKKPHLFGIPLSVKECIAVCAFQTFTLISVPNQIEGERCTWGLAKYINHYSDEDSYQVMKLRSEGKFSDSVFVEESMMLRNDPILPDEHPDGLLDDKLLELHLR